MQRSTDPEVAEDLIVKQRVRSTVIFGKEEKRKMDRIKDRVTAQTGYEISYKQIFSRALNLLYKEMFGDE